MLQQINNYNNLSHYLDSALKRFAEQDAYSCLGQTLTFAEIDEKATRLASYLQSLGLEAGDRIVLQLPNLIQYPISMYAALKAGLVIVNTNPLYTSREMLHQFTDSGAKAIIILSDLVPHLNDIIDRTAIKWVIETKPDDLLSGTEATQRSQSIAFNTALADGTDKQLIESTATLDDIAVLQYTGGTTEVSKGAQLTHKNLIANALQCMERFGNCCNEAEEIFVCPLPLYHIYAFTVSMVVYAGMGNHSILIPNPRDLDALVASIKPFKFTGLAGLNTLFIGLCAKPEFQQLDFSAFKVTYSGGTALTSTAAEQWKKVTGCSISEGYGLSETSPVLTFNEPGNEEIGTVGEPMEETDIQFWDHNDSPVADGETGQLVAKGPQVMKGYWNMPEETAKSLTADGYFKTGDIGLRQANGRIKIVDRLKDMIIVSGFNVYPNEIEDVLSQHPGVLEAAVIGEPNERTGEQVHAYITCKAPATEAELIEFCREQLTPYKVPKKVTIMDELPKSPVGKILRRKLRQPN